jgi:hypothetical protein
MGEQLELADAPKMPTYDELDGRIAFLISTLEHSAPREADKALDLLGRAFTRQAGGWGDANALARKAVAAADALPSAAVFAAVRDLCRAMVALIVNDLSACTQHVAAVDKWRTDGAR